MSRKLNVELANKLADLTKSYHPRVSREEIARNLIVGAVVVSMDGTKTEEKMRNFLYDAIDLAIVQLRLYDA